MQCLDSLKPIVLEMFSKVSNGLNMRSFSIYEGKKKNTIKGEDLNWTRTLQFPLCYKLDVMDYPGSKNITPEKVTFRFANYSNLAVVVFVEDRQMSLDKRPLKSQFDKYTGAKIERENLLSPKLERHVLSISQTIKSKQNLVDKCSNYDSDVLQSYKACDEKFVHDEIKSQYQFMPFWATSNDEEVTKSRYR